MTLGGPQPRHVHTHQFCFPAHSARRLRACTANTVVLCFPRLREPAARTHSAIQKQCRQYSNTHKGIAYMNECLDESFLLCSCLDDSNSDILDNILNAARSILLLSVVQCQLPTHWWPPQFMASSNNTAGPLAPPVDGDTGSAAQVRWKAAPKAPSEKTCWMLSRLAEGRLTVKGTAGLPGAEKPAEALHILNVDDSPKTQTNPEGKDVKAD